MLILRPSSAKCGGFFLCPDFRVAMKKLILKLIQSKRARARALPWVGKTLTLVLIALAILAGSPNFKYDAALAEPTLTVATSAVQADIGSAEADARALKLAAYLESKNSVLAPYAVDFVKSADKYGLDWRLLVAISGVESGFAKIYVVGTYNSWGWGGGYINLGSWDNAIEVISKALNENYATKWQARTVEEIGPIWAEDPNWSKKVNLYLNQIDKFQI